jgi:hypothetical protein
MKTDNLINIINNLLRNSIRILKDEDYQRRVWFRNEGAEESWYTETVFHFLDSSDKILDDPACVDQLGEQNFSLLRQLHDQLTDHVDLLEERTDPDCLEENELLDDPNWHDIQTLSEDLFIKLTDFVARNSHEN